ncbi:GNAT family N-acetyltransferase [Altericroceibacterium xinjiangense]|uniref:GNAT family N-acetyltransferase n=1 Tax=Altericroceibacterium xinjiangense TaxID=762261 RepID=UPI000F7EFA6E|nr:GNAT family N-acetyltransferase [Altericroceibacterium xinjiangense]
MREARAEDAEALTRIGQDSFIGAFGHLYAPDDLDAFLSAHRSLARARDDIADPDVRICLAEHPQTGALAGYCLIRLGQQFDERPAPKPQRPVLLGQLYCLPGSTGAGIGAALLEWAIDQARAWGADAVQLSVYSENFGAQRFYRRYGFQHVADIDYWVGNHRDDEFLYELRI